MRSALTRLHRWIGLVTAGFLLVAGLTGALLAWYDELDALLAPALLTAAPSAGHAQVLDPLALRARVAQAYPGRLVHHVPLNQPPGRSAVFFTTPLPGDPATRGQPPVQVLVQPYTGQVLGARVLGEAVGGAEHLMPFIYRLHHSLALDLAGTLVLGAAALLWTVDCFVGLCLTLPGRAAARARRPDPAPGWLRRWAPAWRMRWSSGGYRRIHDLHRATGLWLWAMLFVFAWSSVAFNLAPVYDAVMARAGLDSQATTRSLPRVDRPRTEPGLGWPGALAHARQLMRQQALAHGFTVEREDLLHYDAQRAVFSYYVRSSLDVRERVGRTMLAFDADDGQLRRTWLPTGAAHGDTVTSWLTGLHMAAFGGWPLQAFVSAMGLAVALLSVTGVLVWRRKAVARSKARAGRSAGA